MSTFNVGDKLRLKFRNMNFQYTVFAVQTTENGQVVQASAIGRGALRFTWDPARPSQFVRMGRYEYWIVYEGSGYANAT